MANRATCSRRRHTPLANQARRWPTRHAAGQPGTPLANQARRWPTRHGAGELGTTLANVRQHGVQICQRAHQLPPPNCPWHRLPGVEVVVHLVRRHPRGDAGELPRRWRISPARLTDCQRRSAPFAIVCITDCQRCATRGRLRRPRNRCAVCAPADRPGPDRPGPDRPGADRPGPDRRAGCQGGRSPLASPSATDQLALFRHQLALFRHRLAPLRRRRALAPCGCACSSNASTSRTPHTAAE